MVSKDYYTIHHRYAGVMRSRGRGEGYRYVGTDPRLEGAVASSIDDCDCEIDEKLDLWDPARRSKVRLTDGREFRCVPFADFVKETRND